MTIAIIEILCYMAVDMYLASMTDISEYFGTSYSKVQLSLTFYLFAMGDWTAFLWSNYRLFWKEKYR